MLMLRETAIHGDAFDMTMSMLRAKQFEACERRLYACPQVALFSDEATNADAQALLSASFDDIGGLSSRCLLTIGELRAAVLSRLPLEAQFLDVDERYLLELLLKYGGELLLDDPDRIGAAESLVRRLWCSVTPAEGRWHLLLPAPLHEGLSQAMNLFGKSPLWFLLRQFDTAVDTRLYAAGMVYEHQPMELFLSQVVQRDDWLTRDVARRYMMASFDYVTDHRGQLILLHPGLVDPDRMLAMAGQAGTLEAELIREEAAAGMYTATNEERLIQALFQRSVDMLPEERILHDHMCAALRDALRPDYEVEECAEDLRLLVKQDYPYEEIREAMKAMLAVMPSAEMEKALGELYFNTPRWMGLRAARVQ